jgi:ATP-dependent DNA helicase DinG
MSILSHFPLATPRVKQVKALEYIEKVVGLGYRDIVIVGPTGLGKTLVGATVCAWAETQTQLKGAPGGYTLVMQKVLQDQIANELAVLGGKTSAALIKSAVEYRCPMHKACSIGRMKGRCELPRLGSCTYKLAKEKFLQSIYAVTNYAYLWTERDHVGELIPRRAVVCDECHGLSKLITSHNQVEIAEDHLEDYAPSLEDTDLREITNRKDFLSWVTAEYLPKVKEQVEILAALAADGGADDASLKLAFEVEQHYIKVNGAVKQYKANSADWVFWRSEDVGPVTLTLRPVEAAPYFQRMIGDVGDLRVYMSAYPGSKAVFCRELGLVPDKVAWLSLSSSFPPENRPVVMLPVGSLCKAKQEANLGSALRMIEKLAAKHHLERGVIHTHSYALANAVVAHLEKTEHGARVVYPKEADKREAAITHHKETEASILVSPSVGEGFDFKDEAARWQIIVKAPWAGLGDKQVATKAERSPDWYKMEAFKSLLQTAGRGCRSETDFCVTYVLDEDVIRLLAEVDAHVPLWFKDAIVYPRSV